MRKIAIQMCSVIVWAGCFSVPALAQQQQNGSDLTPPPAYTPPPKGAAPAEDTPAQLDALAILKARAEKRTGNLF
jgi:hypothetical protein